MPHLKVEVVTFNICFVLVRVEVNLDPALGIHTARGLTCTYTLVHTFKT